MKRFDDGKIFGSPVETGSARTTSYRHGLKRLAMVSTHKEDVFPCCLASQ